MTSLIQRAPAGRADLLRALVAHGDEGLGAVAKMLDYEEVEPADTSREQPRTSDEPFRSPRSSDKEPPRSTHIEYDETPFWRATAVEYRSEDVLDAEPWDRLKGEDLPRDHGVALPERPPIAPWPVLWRVLEERLRSPRESREIDVDRLTALWSRGRIPRRVPRRSRSFLGRVSLIVDRDRRLVPFWDDQSRVAFELERRLAPTDLRQLSVPARGPIRSVGFDSNDIVLALGDLGFYDNSHGPWQAMARGFRRSGVRLLALVPCPPGRWHRPTARAWSALDWSAPSRSPELAPSAAGEAETEQLLRFLSVAVRIDPGLVRSLRLFLPAADCGTEIDVQRHTDLATEFSGYWQFHGAAVHSWRRQLASVPLSLRRAVAAEVLRWHRHLSLDLQLELAENLRAVGVELDTDHDIETKYRRIVEGVAAVMERDPPEGQMRAAVESWLARFAHQVPSAIWRNQYGPAMVRAFRAYRDRYPESPLPPGVTPDMLPGRGSSESVESWDVRQVGDALRVEPANSLGTGSYVTTISVGDRVLRLSDEMRPPVSTELDGADIVLPDDTRGSLRLISDQEEVVLEATPRPLWATRGGRDGYGLWAAFEFRGVEQRMRWIPPGRFWMGSPDGEAGRDNDEGPRHLVTLTEGFWMGEVPCTQALWQAVTGETPSRFEGENRPVEQVSWDDVQEFLDRLSFQIRGLDAVLPTEAEWEYACRAGTETPTWLGDNTAEVLDQVAIYRENSGGQTHDVGGRTVNPWGLGDMLGNVYEWCWDWRGPYSTATAIDPEGPSEGSHRVLRGGAWASNARSVRAAYRFWAPPGDRHSSYGFRLSSGPGVRGAPGGERADAAPKAARRGTSRRARSRRSRAWVDRLGWAVDGGTDAYGRWAAFEVEGVVHRLRWIYPGRFAMGSPENEAGRLVRESPRHVVELTEGFWLGEVPCTQALYEAVTGENPSRFPSAERPVEQVSWEDCRRFFEQLRTKVPGFAGRLPTEAQWEYACRAGTDTATWLGDLEILGAHNAPLLDEIAWYGGNSGVDFDLSEGADSSDWPEKQYPHDRAGTHPVGRKRPNPWGLHDMLGNVWEWCEDAWDGQSGYPGGDRVDPVGTEGSSRVLRGGSWASYAQGVRAAFRYWHPPGYRRSSLGFRLSSGPGWRTPG